MAAKRQPVAKGGLWSTQAAAVSQETQQLLKVMMEESKLTNFQRRQLNDTLSKGQSLPTAVNPTSSRTKQPQRSSPNNKPLPKVLNARHLGSGGKRTKDAINKIGEGQKADTFVPSPGKQITATDKRRLQNVMAYGEFGKNIEDNPRPKKHNDEKPSRKPEPDRFDEVLEEIEDRKQFLEEMESLGKGDQYRTIVNTEISQKVRELEVIDQQRSKELDSLIKAEES